MSGEVGSETRARTSLDHFRACASAHISSGPRTSAHISSRPRRAEPSTPAPSGRRLSWTGVHAKRRGVCKIRALNLIAGSQHLFEVRVPIMVVVLAGKEAGEAL
jgi:hypothetical protein